MNNVKGNIGLLTGRSCPHRKLVLYLSLVKSTYAELVHLKLALIVEWPLIWGVLLNGSYCTKPSTHMKSDLGIQSDTRLVNLAILIYSNQVNVRRKSFKLYELTTRERGWCITNLTVKDHAYVRIVNHTPVYKQLPAVTVAQKPCLTCRIKHN